MPPVLMGIWYTARCVFGIVSSILDMGLYCLIVGLGFFLLYHLQKKPWRERQVGIAIMLAGLWGGVLLIGSAALLTFLCFNPFKIRSTQNGTGRLILRKLSLKSGFFIKIVRNFLNLVISPIFFPVLLEPNVVQ